MSYVGKAVVKELKGSAVQIKYGIDKNAGYKEDNVDVITIDECKADVDVIVVTPISFFEEIERELEMRVDCPIVSIEDVLDVL